MQVKQLLVFLRSYRPIIGPEYAGCRSNRRVEPEQAEFLKKFRRNSKKAIEDHGDLDTAAQYMVHSVSATAKIQGRKTRS